MYVGWPEPLANDDAAAVFHIRSAGPPAAAAKKSMRVCIPRYPGMMYGYFFYFFYLGPDTNQIFL